MGDWSYLLVLLDKVQSHSTVVGKIWMSVLFLFRILVLGAAADNVWADEHSEFICHVQEPGCWHACYNWMFPISYIRYWVFQIVFVSTPSLVYLGHAIHVIHKENKLREQIQKQTDPALFLKRPKYTDERGKVQIKGVLLRSYITQLVCKIILEVGFIIGQFYIFGSVIMVPYFHCKQNIPCPMNIGSECYISRPTEKTIFIIFMMVVTGVSVLLNIIEIMYLLCSRKKARSAAHHHPTLDVYSPSPSGPVWSTNGTSRHRDSPPPFPTEDLVDIHEANSSNNLASKVKNP